MSDYFILHGQELVPCGVREWATWFENAREDRRVARTERDGVAVSTVFLGLDHSFGEGPPQLFETLVFNGEHDGDMERCSTWAQAEEQHEAMCRKVWP